MRQRLDVDYREVFVVERVTGRVRPRRANGAAALVNGSAKERSGSSSEMIPGERFFRLLSMEHLRRHGLAFAVFLRALTCNIESFQRALICIINL